MQALDIFAGPSALKTIKKEGITPQMFTAFLGASGGPKWFVLSGLDKVIFNEFLDHSEQHIDIIGSSVGAFRTACFAQNDPGAAISRLAERYSTTVYSPKPNAREITQKGVEVLRHMVNDDSVQEILSNPRKSVHIIAARCHGLVAKEPRLQQGSGLLLAAFRNMRGRQFLKKSFSRVIFQTGTQPLSFVDEAEFSTEYAQLTKDNLHMSLMASGSIPMVIEGVENIPGVAPGMFRDGGIIDYHFDLKINTPGLVLYPHFYPTPVPGWFDKNIKSRQCHATSYDNVVLLAPSAEFVAKLPYGKITDRDDFKKLTAEDRIKYWKTVISESDRLAESFFHQIQSDNVAEFVQPIRLKR
ncbi:patatin-like phospholipase family protein [Glaciecola sp. 1036]|uniref:patatin-like phospholipase family protein n=1 Tax=Alteromonadaceae TaxID=72275 RepID=UPI003D06F034